MPQFRSEFRDNTQEWGSPTSISNPHYTTTNPMVKQKDLSELSDTLTKAYQRGQDADMALLCYRSISIIYRLPSLANLMYSRRYRTPLPIRTMFKSIIEVLMNVKSQQACSKTTDIHFNPNSILAI